MFLTDLKWSQIVKKKNQFTFSYLDIKVRVLIARSIQLGFAVDVFDVVICSNIFDILLDLLEKMKFINYEYKF